MDTLHVQMEVPISEPAIEAAMEGLVGLNVARMTDRRLVRRYPPLYRSGIVYRREAPGMEVWQSADEMLRTREADCEDLSAYRTAELRVAGEPARAIVGRTASGVYHAVVLRGDGTIEDPSRILITMEANKMKAKPKVSCKQVGDHYVGSIEIPMGGGHTLQAAELGFDPWGALTKVVSKVFEVVSNPAVSAMLPPQAAIAIQMVKRITDMSPSGLKKLIVDDRASPAEKTLAAKVLDAKQDQLKDTAHFQGSDLGASSFVDRMLLKRAKTAPRVLSKTTSGTRTSRTSAPPGTAPGTVDPNTGMTWDGTRWTMTQPQYPGMPAPSSDYPGYPVPGYPMPGYPMPGYPMPGYPGMPMSSMPGYPAMPPQYPPMWPWPAEQQGPAPQPMTPEEAAAVMLWGQDSFAEGSFPGYDESGGGAQYPYPEQYPYPPY